MQSAKFCPTEPVPSEKFVGRTSELYTIFDQIHDRGHVAISGSFGIGKTSLLKYIKSPNYWEEWEEKELNFSKALIVYHNCEISLTPQSFWQEVLKELKNEAQGDEDLQSKIDDVLKLETIEVRDIRQILREIGKRDKFLLLLLDDYHRIVGTQEDYTNNLKNLKKCRHF